jgi:hypothetical protein
MPQSRPGRLFTISASRALFVERRQNWDIQGLAFDSHGDPSVADYGNGRVIQYTGSVTTAVTAPEFPALVVPMIFTMALATVMLLSGPERRFR